MATMKISNAIISGIAGTAVMTLSMQVLASVTKQKLQLVRVLGNMITRNSALSGELSENKMLTIGWISHYFAGIMFAISYIMLWHWNVGKAEIPFALVFGFENGLLGIMIWLLLMHFLPNPPDISIQSNFYTLMVGHIIFGLTVFGSYKFLNEFQMAFLNL
jgi:uncharacterized membrane protein YagU involved in acid resistance